MALWTCWGRHQISRRYYCASARKIRTVPQSCYAARLQGAFTAGVTFSAMHAKAASMQS